MDTIKDTLPHTNAGPSAEPTPKPTNADIRDIRWTIFRLPDLPEYSTNIFIGQTIAYYESTAASPRHAIETAIELNQITRAGHYIVTDAKHPSKLALLRVIEPTGLVVA